MNFFSFGFTVHSEPSEVKSDGFTYHETNGLSFNNIALAPISELRLLFRKNAAKSRVRAANKTWVSAQLRMYDIPFRASDRADALKSTLEAAVNAGKCDKLPASIAAKEQFLRKKLEDQRGAYDRMRLQEQNRHFARLTRPSEQARWDFDKFLAKYFLDDHGQPAPQKQPEAIVMQDYSYNTNPGFVSIVRAIPGLEMQGTDRPDLTVIGWRGSAFEKGLDDAFATLSSPYFPLHTPTSEANFDCNRFMAKYFLSGLKGRPEKNKTPKPIELYQFLSSSAKAAIYNAAKSIPGLGVAHTVHDGHLVIGWETELVAFAQQHQAAIDKEVEEKRLQQEAQEKAEFEERMEDHREYAKTHCAQPGPLKLEHLVGSYRAECPEFEEESSLDIHPPTNTSGAKAAFHFGMIEGTMLMALSQDALEQLREETMKADKDDDEEWEDYGWGRKYPFGYEDEEEDKAAGCHQSSASGKRKAMEELESSRPAVKRKLEENPHPNRVYVQWRGRETAQSVIEVDYSNSHVGYFDFENGGLTAQGKVFHSFHGSKLEIKLYKTDDKPQSQAEPWSNFSERKYECARTGRWH